jgi:predicted nucleotidyltransferase component of viral defense system
MQGLSKDTAKIFRAVSLLSCLNDYILIGGTALSLQINKRKSEDLDFCVWTKKLKKDKPSVDWSAIERELETVGPIESRDILGFEQVNFVVRGVRMTFVAKPENLSPVKSPVPILHNIFAADICAIGAMKIELILRRSEFRDYYDIYSILKEGFTLKDIVSRAVKYSNHRLKTRDALAYLSNGSNFKPDRSFSLLEPFYDIDNKGIEEHIRNLIRKEYIQ